MDTTAKELVAEEGSSGKSTGPKASVTSLVAVRKGLPVDENLYRRAISVNGQVEFEEPWSLPKKFFGQIYFAICMLDTLFVQALFFIFVWPFLGKESPMKRDPRKRPVSFLLYMLSSHVTFLKENATTWRAIEYLYTWNEKTAGVKGLNRLVTSFLGYVENILATRNRLRNTKSALFWQFHHRFSSGMQDIAILSIAAGSARAAIEALVPFLQEDPKRIKRVRLGFLDDDPSALEFAKQFASESFPGLEERLTLKRMKISVTNVERFAEFEAFLKEFDPEIVEMVGFTDYMSHEKAVKVINAVNRHMRSGGFFITNNVKPNHERHFLELCVAWRMLNRSEAEMLKILEESGFKVFRTLNEPTNIQPVYAALKDIDPTSV